MKKMRKVAVSLLLTAGLFFPSVSFAVVNSLNGLGASTQFFATSTNPATAMHLRISTSGGNTHNFLWDGTPWLATQGGTGFTTTTPNRLLLGAAGNTWTQVATSSLGLLTTNVQEGTNLYYTALRDIRFSTTSADHWFTFQSSSTTNNVSNATGTLAVSHGGTGATAFTTGSVLFMGASTISQNNSNFFWDNGNTALRLGGALSGSTTLARLTVSATSTQAAVKVFNSLGSIALFIGSDGKVGVGTTTPTEVLDVAGNVKVSGSATAATLTTTSTTASSTFANGVNLTSGCFAVNGVCVGGASSPTPPSSNPTEDFDSYSNGASVNGLNGGAGWTGAWSKVGGGTYDIVETPTFSLARAAHAVADGGGTGTAYRSINAVGHFILSATVRQTSNTTANGLRVGALSPSQNTAYAIQLDNGNIGLLSASGTVSVLGFNPNTWYTVELEVDSANTRNRARAKEEGGAFSSWSSWTLPFAGTETNSPNTILYAANGSAGEFDAYFDNISVTPVN